MEPFNVITPMHLLSFCTNTVTGTTTNLAVLPGTSTPISVITIRNDDYNDDCNSANPQYLVSF